MAQGDQKGKEQASGVENLPLVENLCREIQLQWKFSKDSDYSKGHVNKLPPHLFAEVDNHLITKYTICFPSACVLLHQPAVQTSHIHIEHGDI